MVAERYLRFDVKRPFNGRPLLWPVKVWKILYPTQRIIKLNLFQQAILGLIRARCNDINELSELLGLDQQLISFIIEKQLIPNGWIVDDWLTKGGSVTFSGQRVLEDALDASEEIRIGYAFQDGITGDWMPRFTEELIEIEASRVDHRGIPSFQRDLDSGKEDRPFRVHAQSDLPTNLNSLFDAFKKFRTDQNYYRQLNVDLPPQLNTDSLKFIEETGQSMWLWTWVFPENTGANRWLVSDPFSLQSAVSWIRKPLQELLPNNNALALYISDLLGESRPEEMTASEWLSSLENQNDLLLMTNYSWATKVPLIQEYLKNILFKKKYLESIPFSLQSDIDSLLSLSQQLVESNLKWMLQTFPVDRTILPKWDYRQRIGQKDWKHGQSLDYLNTIKQNIGVLSDDFVSRMSRIELEQIRIAIRSQNCSLKALLFGAVLGMVDRAEHPLLSLKDRTYLLDSLFDLADARNKKSSHASSLKATKDEALDFAEISIEWVKLFKEWY